jgi:hypothetical protein
MMASIEVCVYCSHRIEEKEKSVNLPAGVAHLACAQKATTVKALRGTTTDLRDCNIRESMARVLFIVARDQPELLASLRENFATQEAAGLVEIFHDRRQGLRQPGVESDQFDRHQRDWRRILEVSRDLHGLGCAVVHRQETTPSRDLV